MMTIKTDGSKPPKQIWLVVDPMDGPHIFRSEKAAERQMGKWKREAKDAYWDSYWDMSGPWLYALAPNGTREARIDPRPEGHGRVV